LPALEAVERALRRIDNTVERALKVDLYAPELDARREAMDAIVTRCAPLVRAMRAPAVSDLEGAVAFLRALLPLAWNASDEETPRWLSANWLLLGTVAFELKRATQAGLAHRLWGHDVLWFERDDGEVVSFAVPHARGLQEALEQQGHTLQRRQVVPGAAEERMRRRCSDHFIALEAFSRDPSVRPDVAGLVFTTEELTAERLDLLERQSAFMGHEGPRLVERVARERRKASGRLLQLLRALGDPGGEPSDFLALFERLVRHLPLEGAGQ
jgi:hypothetical protein